MIKIGFFRISIRLEIRKDRVVYPLGYEKGHKRAIEKETDSETCLAVFTLQNHRQVLGTA